ncbi:UBIQUITIN-CONJUGAT-2 domain-containing protein [Mycena sanguinolenta]|uniref:UBIQUITIN-CONJUGAT-2 domain-containing protein n=1 Tax=Mycena sanguinolenta TaxID=230812 RepID=A0A8H6XLQ6_9AGAR|nr:UBIQUITIN-CONJUGAT-2 domain-containing protein [Mycena sanguinolenta]
MTLPPALTGKRQVHKVPFVIKHGLRFHGYGERAPYPLPYSKHVFELESLDMRLVSHMTGGSVSFVDFSDENWTKDGGATPEHSLDLGCGTGAWVIDAAKEWPTCDFVGFDLMDIQIPLMTLSPEYASIAERITWVHGNFLTDKLPFEDDEFDHVHIHAIAQGVPENKVNLSSECWITPSQTRISGASYLRKSTVFYDLAESSKLWKTESCGLFRHVRLQLIELCFLDVIFPLLPKWFTASLRARPRRPRGVRYPDGTQRGLDDNQPDTPPHDHALLESLYKSVFEARFINFNPTAILPSYFTTYFRHVTLSPVINFSMPPIPPLQPPSPQIASSSVIDSNEFSSSASPSHWLRPTSVSSVASTSTDSTAVSSRASISSVSSTASGSTAVSSRVSIFTRWREKQSLSVSTHDSSDTAMTVINELPDPPKTTSVPRNFVLDITEKFGSDMEMDGEEPVVSPEEPVVSPEEPVMSPEKPVVPPEEPVVSPEEPVASPEQIPFRNRLDLLNERSLAMHLYRSYQLVLACQEEMWEELKDRIRNRPDELKSFGWDEDEELEELQDRKKFEILIGRYRSHMQIRTVLWCSLTGIGWPFPPREPLSRTELIEEQKIRAAMIQARMDSQSDESPSPCRSLRVLVGYKL